MPMYDWLTQGTVFDTEFELGCVVETMPDDRGNFYAYDSDNVLCTFHVDMVVKGENYYGKHNS